MKLTKILERYYKIYNMRIIKIYHQSQKFIKKNAFNSLLKFTYYFIVTNYKSYVDHCASLA